MLKFMDRKAPASSPSTATEPIRHFKLQPITLFSVILEFSIIFLMAFSVTALYRDPDSNKKLYGGEAEWLTSSVYMADKTLQENGHIAYWQPFLASGEPLIDNPFSFVLNPVSFYPVIAMGGEMGIRFSVFLYALVAGYGAWALGRVIGFGVVARLLLAGLLIGKGNMVAMIGQGYYQLGVTQAYMPWIIAGAIGVFRLQKRRWPIILTAIALTLMWFGGNIWYTLPMILMIGLLTLTHLFFRTATGRTGGPGLAVDWLGLRRLLVAAIFTLGLAMVTFLPIWVNQSRIANHPNEKNAGVAVDIGRILNEFVDGNISRYYYFAQGTAPGAPEIYFSYISPLWFIVLLFVVLPPIIPGLFKAPQPGYWRIWLVVVLMLIIATIWGSGGNPIFVFLYQNLPLLGQWRFVGRALAVSTFCIAILLAMRVDGLWRALVQEGGLVRRLLKRLPGLQSIARLGLAAAILAVSWAAVAAVNQNWNAIKGQSYLDSANDTCVAWLRRQNPDRPLSVYGPGYFAIATYLRNDVRLFNIAADFGMIPDPPTIYNGNLLRALPEFGLAWEDGVRAYFRENDFDNLQDSPNPIDANHCIWRNSNALSYAFSMPTDILARLPPNSLSPIMTTPITELERHPDDIGLIVQSDPVYELTVTVQEGTYPGWTAEINGKQVRLESVGGQLGVRLAPGTGRAFIHFSFRPPLLFVGGVFTLITALLCALYLLRFDRFIPRSLYARFDHGAATAVSNAARVLFNPQLFTPKDEQDSARAADPILIPPRIVELPDEPKPEVVDSEPVITLEPIDHGPAPEMSAGDSAAHDD
jgi:hypothetical protein